MASFFRQFNAIGPLFCSFVQLLGREVNPDFLGSEKQESVGSSLALNHKFFMLPKVERRPKSAPFAVFSALGDIFPEIFEFYQRVPPWIFEVFGLLKTFNKPKGSFFGFFGNMRLFFTKYFFEKKFQVFPIVVPRIFLSLRYEADLGLSHLVPFELKRFNF